MNNQAEFNESKSLTIKSLNDVFCEGVISMENLNEHEGTETENKNFNDQLNPKECKESINNNDKILSDNSIDILNENEESTIDNEDSNETIISNGRSEVSKQYQKTLNRKENEENLSNFSDDLTVEESEERINILQAVFAFVLITIATSFTIIVIKNVPQDPVTFPWTLEIYQPQNGMLLK